MAYPQFNRDNHTWAGHRDMKDRDYLGKILILLNHRKGAAEKDWDSGVLSFSLDLPPPTYMTFSKFTSPGFNFLIFKMRAIGPGGR